MTDERAGWAPTTHAWTDDVDHAHLADIRRRAHELAPTGVTHLVLEVLAYPDDEAAALHRRGLVHVTLFADGWIEVSDNGRGTDTRLDADGRPVRKPVMATKDLRFFDTSETLLPDGAFRHGISVVAALSEELVHENHRCDGSWTQRYRHGVPVGHLTPAPQSDIPGTSVRFLPDGSLMADRLPSADEVAALASGFEHVTVEVARLPVRFGEQLG